MIGTRMGVRHNFRAEIKEYLDEILYRSKSGMEQIRESVRLHMSQVDVYTVRSSWETWGWRDYVKDTKIFMNGGK